MKLLISFFLFLVATTLQAAPPQDIKDTRYENRQYRSVMLPNGMKTLLISDPDIEKASAALQIPIGGSHDPKGREGMAHFLEHLLFLGTAKYPKAGEFEEFLEQTGGYTNAFTTREDTQYFFEINPQHLEAGLDRWSQFFISPLFDPKFIESEIKVVHSEFSNSLSSHYRLREAAIRSTLNPNHPALRFFVGNTQTLSQISRQEVIDFYHSNYSSHLMTLAILGRQSLDELQEFALKYFQQIPRRHVQEIKITQKVLLPTEGVRFLQVKPQKEIHELLLRFYLPTSYHYYRSRPLSAISFFLGHEGKGSLFSFLKDKGLVTKLGAAYSVSRVYSILDLRMRLTKEGKNNYRQIVNYIFQYIKMLRHTGIPLNRLEELLKVLDLNFKYAGRQDGARVTGAAVEIMQIMPSRALYTPPSANIRFDSKITDRFLFWLRPENLLIVLTDPSVQTEATAPIYGTPYTYQNHDQKWLKKLKSIKPNHILKLPSKNQWLPDSLFMIPKQTPFYFSHASLLGLQKSGLAPEILEKLKQVQDESFETWQELKTQLNLDSSASQKKIIKYAFNKPYRLIDKEGMRLWFAQDISFDTPKSSVRLVFHNPKLSQDVRSDLLGELYASILREKLNEFRYELNLAGSSIHLYTSKQGLHLQVYGYSDKLWKVLDFIIEQLHQLEIPQKRFEDMKKEYLRRYRNVWKKSPLAQSSYFQGLLFEQDTKSVYEYQKELESIRLGHVQRFGKMLLTQAFIEGFAYGNLDPRITRLAIRQSLRKLEIQPLTEDQIFKRYFLQIPQNTYVFQYPSSVKNSATKYIVQLGKDTPQLRMKGVMLRKLLKASFYTELRTQKKLGYTANTYISSNDRFWHLVFVLQSADYSALRLHQEIEAFLQQIGTRAESLPDEVFEKTKQSMQDALLELPASIEDVEGMRWSAIVDQEKDLGDASELLQELAQMTKQDVIDFAKQVFPKEKRRAISIHVLDKDLEPQDEIPDAILIEDLEQFKQSQVYLSK